jgi:hypothetical protein
MTLHAVDNLLGCIDQLIRERGINSRGLRPDFVLKCGQLVGPGNDVAAIE